jgi:hypothetical protein
MADHLPFMLRLRESQGLGSLIDEISLACMRRTLPSYGSWPAD